MGLEGQGVRYPGSRVRTVLYAYLKSGSEMRASRRFGARSRTSLLNCYHDNIQIVTIVPCSVRPLRVGWAAPSSQVTCIAHRP